MTTPTLTQAPTTGVCGRGLHRPCSGNVLAEQADGTIERTPCGCDCHGDETLLRLPRQW